MEDSKGSMEDHKGSTEDNKGSRHSSEDSKGRMGEGTGIREEGTQGIIMEEVRVDSIKVVRVEDRLGTREGEDMEEVGGRRLYSCIR